MTVYSVADLTIDEFRKIIREEVVRTVKELLDDPDANLELRDDFKVELQQSLAAIQIREQTRPSQDVAVKLGPDW